MGSAIVGGGGSSGGGGGGSPAPSGASTDFDISRMASASAVAGSQTSTMDAAWDAIMAAAAALPVVSGKRPPIRIKFPSNGPNTKWLSHDPLLIDGLNVTCYGEGIGSTFLGNTAGNSTGLFLVGLSASPGGVSLTSGHWIDLNGILDASMVTTAATLYGYRTLGNSHIAFVANAFSQGAADNWSLTRQLTFDFFVDFLGNAIPASVPYFNINDSLGKPCPFRVTWTAASQFVFQFRTAEQTGYAAPVRQTAFTVPNDPATGLAPKGKARITVQVDLINATVSGFIALGNLSGSTAPDGVRMAASTTLQTFANAVSTSLPFTAASNLRFIPNAAQWAFNLNSGAHQAYGYGSGNNLHPDQCYYGLKVSGDIRYVTSTGGSYDAATGLVTGSTPTATGSAQTCATTNTSGSAASGATLNDVYRFSVQGAQASAIAYLKLTDTPTGRYGGRMVHMRNGSATGSSSTSVGWYYSDDPTDGTAIQGYGLNTSQGIVIQDMCIQGQTRWGQGICQAAVTNMTVSRVKSQLFWHCYGCADSGSCWNVWITDCMFTQGYDACLHMASTLFTLENLNTDLPNSTVVFRMNGCDAVISNVWMGTTGGNFASRAMPNTPALSNGAIVPLTHIADIHASGYGGSYVFDGCNYDGENSGYPTVAFVEIENHPNYVFPTTLTLRNTKFGQAASTFGGIILHDVAPPSNPGNAYLPALLIMEDCSDFTRSMPFYVKVDGPLWRGRLANNNLPLNAVTTPIDASGAPGGISNVVWVTMPGELSGPPRFNIPYYAGALEVPVLRPADGGYGLIKCTGSGQYGTGTVPVWTGFEQVQLSTNNIP